jgi:cobalamin biosynthesis Mg chelatase CobN
MQRLLSLAAACLISCAMAFGQGTVTDQNPATSGTQKNPNTVNATPNSNGTAPVNAQGRAARTPSSSNQSLPGNSNPANAATSDAGANAQAVKPNGAKSGTAGTAAGNTPNSGDNSDNNGMAKDDTGNNAASGRGSKTITNPGTAGTVQWFWIALGVIIAVVLIGILMSRNRADANIDSTDPALRSTRDRKDRRDDQIRRAG